MRTANCRLQIARVLGIGGLAVAAACLPAAAGTPLMERLTEEHLSMLSRGAEELRKEAHPSGKSGEYLDVRCVLHAHSALSHDSRGTPEQIAAAAKAAGVRAVFMTEHPTPDRRRQTEGLRGEKDGVLFIPGAELSDGLLIWRGEKAQWTPEMKAAEVLRALQGTDGAAFLAHPEQRKDDAWDLPPYAGMEIYNSHADAADNHYESVLAAFRGGDPLKVLSFIQRLKQYPQAAYAAIFDEQVSVLKRWDDLNAGFLPSGRRVVGIAANDAHQNVGIRVEVGDGALLVKDALGAKIGELSKGKVPALLLGGLKPGAVLLSHQFDPYEVAFRYVSTHLLAPEVSEDALFDSLLHGRAYVAFDWMGDPSGFRYFATTGNRTVETGGDVAAAERPTLTVRPNMPCELRLLRNGQEVRRLEGEELTFPVQEPGVYRAEAWVRVGSEARPWVYSNPIYVGS